MHEYRISTKKFHSAFLILVMAGALQTIPFAGLLGPPTSAGETKRDFLLDRALGAIAMGREDLSIRADLSSNPFPLTLFSRWMEEPVKAPKEAQEKVRDLFGLAPKPFLWLRELAALGDLISPEPLSLRKSPVRKIPGDLPEPLTKAVQLMLDAIYTAELRIATVRGALGTEKMALLKKHLYPDFCGEGGVAESANDWVRKGEVKEAIDTAGKLDRRGILEAGLTILKALAQAEELLGETKKWAKDIPSISFDTPVGLVEIGGMGSDLHENAATIIIDLGGDDLYRGKTASGIDGKSSVVLDLSGNDIYLGEDFTQASGIWGVGVLFDLEGDDLYRARNCSQGAGLFGVGILFDGGGMDSYMGGKFVQAASAWGFGGLIDLAGEDVYQIQRSGQAYSEVLGVSGLFDMDGNDKYISGKNEPDPREPDMNQSFSQGFARGMRNLAAGGFALLADRSGNDLYQSQYFAQGASYWMAVGLLYDENGKDTYIARRYAQGAGIHFSLGLLMDVGGDDYTISWGVSQGSGHDYGIGLLINEEGDDTYASSWLSMGASEANGIGIFVDNSGNDSYETRTGMAVGQFIEKRRAGGIGLFIDAGGKDGYSRKGADNTTWGSNRWGVGVDKEEGGVSGLNILPSMGPSHERTEAKRKRQREKARLSKALSLAEAMPLSEGIEGMLSVASHWGFERELPQKAREDLLNLSPEKSVPALASYLDTPDIMSLLFMEKFFAVHGYHAFPELVQKTSDPDPVVVARALYFLGRLKDSRGLGHALQALKNPSWRVKSAAIRAIGEMLNKKRLEALQPMRSALGRALETNDPGFIRAYLQEEGRERVVLSLLVRAVPLGYKKYTSYGEIPPGEEGEKAREGYMTFLFDHLGEMVPLLERWIDDIEHSEGTAKDLMDSLDDPDPAVKRAAAYSLGQMRYRPAIPHLLSLFRDSELWVRDAAALSLTLFEEEAVPPLTSAMEEETPSFKIIALDALSRIQSNSSRSLIEKYLNDPHENVRRAAGQAHSRL